MFDLGRSFLAAVERRPDAVAISDAALKKTYRQWFIDIQHAAHGLERLGLKRGVTRCEASDHKNVYKPRSGWTRPLFCGLLSRPE